MTVRRARHADGLAERVDAIQPDHLRDGAGAGVVADDNHHHERVLELDREAGLEVLEAAAGCLLVLRRDRHGLIEREIARVDARERGHQDGDLPRTGGGHDGLPVPVGGRARVQVLEIPAGMERLRVAEVIELSHQFLHREPSNVGSVGFQPAWQGRRLKAYATNATPPRRRGCRSRRWRG